MTNMEPAHSAPIAISAFEVDVEREFPRRVLLRLADGAGRPQTFPQTHRQAHMLSELLLLSGAEPFTPGKDAPPFVFPDAQTAKRCADDLLRGIGRALDPRQRLGQ
jgi:hypothetical protein